MLVNLTSNDFEQGFILTGSVVGGQNSDSMYASWNASRIRTKQSFVYNGDGENLTFNVTTTNNPANLYIEITIYDENGKYIDTSYTTFSNNQMTKISDNIFQHTYNDSRGWFKNGIRIFRISLATNLSNPTSDDNFSPNNLSTAEIFSKEYWSVNENGLVLADFPTIPKPMVEPYPLLLWRCSPTEYQGKTYYNDGFPYHMLLKGIPEIDNTPLAYIGNKPIISVYYGNKTIISIYYGKNKIM